MTRRTCSQTSLSFILKFLNLFQLFVGISIILYSIYMLNQWDKHLPIPPSPSPDSSDSVSTIFTTAWASDQLNYEIGGGFSSSPWFIYAFMGLGVTLCCISCTGHIAAESINGCCLCFYALLKTVFVLLEVAFILFIVLDHHWEKDLPSDPTKEIGRIRKFVESNIGFCKWVGIIVVVIQGLCLLLAIVLRAMVKVRDNENDIERSDADVRGKTWEPLLTSAPPPASGDGKAFRSDIWSSRMREKYGLSIGNGK